MSMAQINLFCMISVNCAKLSPNLKLLVSQFNNATQKIVTVLNIFFLSKHYDIDKMHSIKIPHKDKEKPLFLFYINLYSLNKTFDVLQHLLS